MSWNYRVVRQAITDRLGETVDWHEFREVHYYAKDGGEGYENIVGWTIDPSRPGGESLEELTEGMDLICAALSKPVLDMDELERRVGQGPPHWIKAIMEIREFADLEEGWDGYHAAKPLITSIEDAISFCKTAEFGIVHMEPTLHADGCVLLEIGDDGLIGSLKFMGGWIVYSCGRDVGKIHWSSSVLLREVLERVGRDSGDTERPLEVEQAKEQEAS